VCFVRISARSLWRCRKATFPDLGKVCCIHPSQIAIANEVFSPTEQELQWAREVVTAYQQAMVKGTGAISVGDRNYNQPFFALATLGG